MQYGMGVDRLIKPFTDVHTCYRIPGIPEYIVDKIVAHLPCWDQLTPDLGSKTWAYDGYGCTLAISCNALFTLYLEVYHLLS